MGTIGSKLVVYLSSKGVEILAYCYRNLEIHKEQIKNILKKDGNNTLNSLPIIITNDLLSLRVVDLIIDATTEDYQIKKNLYKNISSLGNNDIIIGCTTYSLNLNKLASFYQSEHFFGLHFFKLYLANFLLPILILREAIIIYFLATYSNRSGCMLGDT